MKIRGVIQIILLAIFTLPAASSAFEIAIFKSKNLIQYNDAVNGFKANCQSRFNEFDLEENPERGLQITKMIKESKPDLIFTVGVNAAIIATQAITFAASEGYQISVSQ